MPKLPDGTHVDICLNALGVLNRMNPAQLIEQHINFMSDHVLKQMKATEDVGEKIDIYLSYLKYLDKEQYDFFDGELIMMNRAQKEEFIQEVEDHGIFIHQAPFFKKIKQEHPEWCTRYKCDGIEKPLVVGDIYFIRLKHESSNKASFVSSSTTNTKNQPAKSNLKKNHKTLFQNTPIALGNMETENLLLSKSGTALEKMLKSYSTSKVDRENLVKQLLTTPDPFNIDISIDNDVSINRKILEKYLSVLELSLENTNSVEEDK